MKEIRNHKQVVQGQTGIFQGSVGVFLDNRDPHHGLLYTIHIIPILGNITLKKTAKIQVFLVTAQLFCQGWLCCLWWRSLPWPHCLCCYRCCSIGVSCCLANVYSVSHKKPWLVGSCRGLYYPVLCELK